MMRDQDLGIVRVRAFGTFDFKIVDPKLFLKEVAGSDQNFRLDEFADTMRSRIVSVFTDALATAKVPVFDVASRYTELGEALLPLINPVIKAKYGIEMASFILENVSVPPEVEQAIDKRSSMAAVGNLNDYVKFQMAQGMEKGGGAGGAATEMAVGLAMAKQMIASGDDRGPARRRRPPRSRSPRIPEMLSPGDIANTLKVSEGDVLAILESGELVGKKIGSTWRIKRSSLDEYLARSNWLTVALEKHPCPACGAQAEWNPGKQKLVCPFCGTESPYQITGDRRDRGARSRARAARDARRSARLADRDAHRSVPELQGGLGLRSEAGRPALRVLRVAGARRLHRRSRRRSGRRACCRSRSPRPPSASRSGAGTRASGWRRAR